MNKFIQSEEKNEFNELKKKKLKIAVIGSGISGLSAAWLLSKDHKVTIYEKNVELGGHANTIKIDYPIKNNKVVSINVDTGFIVYNNKNYPNLVNFFKYHNVDTIDSNMSLSISCNNGSYEYSGSGLNGIFGQRKNIFKLRQWKLIYDILKFKKLATKYIKKNNYSQTTIKEWLFKNKFSTSFINYYIIPITSAVWSCSNKDALLFPTQTFLYFFYHHGLLNIKNRPKWRTVKNGSRNYVEKVIKNIEIVRRDLKLSKIIMLNQIHSSNIITIDHNKDNYDFHKADGMVTNLSGLGLSILGADCAPILFYDNISQTIGVCHAGWRGTINDIVEITISKMEAIGAKRKRIIAIIGPAIQKKSYEIGEDVAKIIKQFSFYEPSNDILYSIENNKYLFDLPLLLKQSLKYSKIDQVGDTKLDTYQNNDLFFSHRRTTHESDLKESKTGRQISVIGIIK